MDIFYEFFTVEIGIGANPSIFNGLKKMDFGQAASPGGHF
jgi:hypothetical protein